MSDELAGLTEFLCVAEQRSFTAAARVLGVTPSAVSQTLRTLEERLGVRLLQRTTRSVGLTEAGELFLRRLRPALGGVKEAIDALGELRDRPAGLLRLSVPRLGYEQVLAPALPEFLALYPDIRLDVSIDDAFVDIVESGFDAGMRIGEMVQRDMMGVRLTPDFRTAIVGSPGYFAGRKKPKHPRDLGEHDCINYKRRAQGGLYRWEFTDEGRELEIAVSGRLVLDDGNLMVRAAVDGLGLAYVMESAVRTELAEKRLVRVLESYCEPYPGLFLYYPSRLHVAPKLQALIGHLRRRKHGR